MMMMVLTMFELSLEASLKNFSLICWKCYMLPKTLIYALLHRCLQEPPRVLAFARLIENWPFERFSISEIGVKLKNEDIIMLASLIKNRQIGNIHDFDLIHAKFGELGERASNAILTAVLDDEPVLSVKRYQNDTSASRSFTEAFKYAHNILSKPKVKYSQPSNNIIETAISITMEFFINDMNCSKYIQVMQLGHKYIRITVKRIVFEYISSKNIFRTLNVTDVNKLTGIDFSFNCLMESRLKVVCKELVKYKNLEKISLSYNNITSNDGYLIKDGLFPLLNLKYLNLSWNSLSHSLCDILQNGLQSDHLHTLILSGCGITKECLYVLIHHRKICNLIHLKLDQNKLLSKDSDIKQTLNDLMNKYKHSLMFLDLSSCDINKATLILLAPIFMKLIYLETLVIWPNPEINETTLKNEIFPLFENRRVDIPFTEMPF